MNWLRRTHLGVGEIRKTCWDLEAQSQAYKDNPANWEAIYFSRRISPWITYILKDANVTPNRVTVIWVVMGAMGASLLVFSGKWISMAGVFLLWMAMILDHVDGELARVKKIFSQRGDFLDMLGHQFHYPLIFAALTFKVVLEGGPPFLIFCGLLAAALATPLSKLGENVLLLAALRHLGRPIPNDPPGKNDDPRKPGVRSFLGAIHTQVVMLYALIPAVFFGIEELYLAFYGITMAPVLIFKYHARLGELEEICGDPGLLRQYLRPEWLDPATPTPSPPPDVKE